MTRASREDLLRDLLARVPRGYSPWLHLALPALLGIATAALALGRVEHLRPWQLACVPLFLSLLNAAEWHAHRGLLHRRTWPLEALYDRHGPEHHALYVPGDMSVRGARELRFVLLPASAVPAVVLLAAPVALGLRLAGQPNLAALWLASAVLEVLAHEWLHLACHLPDSGPLGRLGGLAAVRRLRRHHERHHHPPLMQRWNFNVTPPLWDHVRGTAWRAPAASRGAAPRRA